MSSDCSYSRLYILVDDGCLFLLLVLNLLHVGLAWEDAEGGSKLAGMVSDSSDRPAEDEESGALEAVWCSGAVKSMVYCSSMISVLCGSTE